MAPANPNFKPAPKLPAYVKPITKAGLDTLHESLVDLKPKPGSVASASATRKLGSLPKTTHPPNAGPLAKISGTSNTAMSIAGVLAPKKGNPRSPPPAMVFEELAQNHFTGDSSSSSSRAQVDSEGSFPSFDIDSLGSALLNLDPFSDDGKSLEIINQISSKAFDEFFGACSPESSHRSHFQHCLDVGFPLLPSQTQKSLKTTLERHRFVIQLEAEDEEAKKAHSDRSRSRSGRRFGKPSFPKQTELKVTPKHVPKQKADLGVSNEHASDVAPRAVVSKVQYFKPPPTPSQFSETVSKAPPSQKSGSLEGTHQSFVETVSKVPPSHKPSSFEGTQPLFSETVSKAPPSHKPEVILPPLQSPPPPSHKPEVIPPLLQSPPPKPVASTQKNEQVVQVVAPKVPAFSSEMDQFMNELETTPAPEPKREDDMNLEDYQTRILLEQAERKKKMLEEKAREKKEAEEKAKRDAEAAKRKLEQEAERKAQEEARRREEQEQQKWEWEQKRQNNLKMIQEQQRRATQQSHIEATFMSGSQSYWQNSHAPQPGFQARPPLQAQQQQGMGAAPQLNPQMTQAMQHMFSMLQSQNGASFGQ